MEFNKEYLQIIEPYSKKMTESFLNQDFNAMLELHDKNVLLMQPFQPPIKGLAEFKKEISKAKEMMVKYHSLGGKIRNVWGCENKIYEEGTIAFSVSNKYDKKPQSYYGSYITIWQKQKDDDYKIVFSMWNLDYNPFEK